MDLNTLTQMLHAADADGVCLLVATSDGHIITGRQHGVRDLYDLLTKTPDVLCGAIVADKVVGRGAAALLALGGVAQLHADLLSSRARPFLQNAGILVQYDTEVPHIANRAGNGICPVEQATSHAPTPQEALEKMTALFRNAE